MVPLRALSPQDPGVDGSNSSWNVSPELDVFPLSGEQRLELDRRLADAEANPRVGTPWNEIKARLLGAP
jgi:putative addiction module component (TIGR02574 family)